MSGRNKVPIVLSLGPAIFPPSSMIFLDMHYSKVWGRGAAVSPSAGHFSLTESQALPGPPESKPAFLTRSPGDTEV